MDSFYKAEKSKLEYAMLELKRNLQHEETLASLVVDFCRRDMLFEAYVTLCRITMFPRSFQERKIEIFCKRYFPEVLGEIEKYMYPGKQN